MINNLLLLPNVCTVIPPLFFCALLLQGTINLLLTFIITVMIIIIIDINDKDLFMLLIGHRSSSVFLVATKDFIFYR